VRWNKGYNPDIIFISENIKQQTFKQVCNHIPRSQHRPILFKTTSRIRFQRRYNFQKANWLKFSEEVDIKVKTLAATVENYGKFVEIVK